MKKLILSVLTFIVVLSSVSFADSILMDGPGANAVDVGATAKDILTPMYGHQTIDEVIAGIAHSTNDDYEEITSDLAEQIKNANTPIDYSYDEYIDDISTVKFGKYPQSDISGNTKEPIEWIVLEKNDEKALLLSKYVLDFKQYHRNRKYHNNHTNDITWGNCDLRKWLNADFYNSAFSNDEKQKILPTKNLTSHKDYGPPGQGILQDIEVNNFETVDLVFILCDEDIDKYFQSEGLFDFGGEGMQSASCVPASALCTNYYKAKPDSNYTSISKEDVDLYQGILGYERVDVTAYWLRNTNVEYSTYPLNGIEWTTYAESFWNGILINGGYKSIDDYIGVRPAIWVSLGNNSGNANNYEVANQTQTNNVQETTKPAPKNGWIGDYYYVDDVIIKNAWVQYGSDKYYCGPNGAILKNQWIDNTYYVDNTGKMLKNTTTPDGYKVGVDGKYIAETKSTLNQNVANNSNGNLASQVVKAKCVTEYSKDTTVEQMDTVTFGSYPQSDASGNIKEPIEWIVLEKNNNEVLLLSKYILDCKSYNEESKDVTWETCTLRHWLNNTFYNTAFSNDEKKRIIKSYVTNKDNSEYGTSGGNNTNDYVYFLSIDECRKYFGNEDENEFNKRLATKGTEYAKKVDNHGGNLFVCDVTATEWYDGNSVFWLRSPGNLQFVAADVHPGGLVYDEGNMAVSDIEGLRPAIWVNISNTQEVETTEPETKSKWIEISPKEGDEINRNAKPISVIEVYVPQSNNSSYSRKFHEYSGNEITPKTIDIALKEMGVINKNSEFLGIDIVKADKSLNAGPGASDSVLDKKGIIKYKSLNSNYDLSIAQECIKDTFITNLQLAEAEVVISEQKLHNTDYVDSTTTNDNYYNIVLTNEDIKTIKVKEEPLYFLFFKTGIEYKLNIYLTDTGNRKLKEASERNIGLSLHLVCDDKLLIDFKVDKIFNSNEGISASYDSKEQAQDRMNKINGAKSVYLIEGDYQSFIDNKNSTSISKNYNNKNDSENDFNNSSNKLVPLSDEELADLDESALFHLTINNKYVDSIRIGSMKDGFLGLFGNTLYFVGFKYNLKLPEGELVVDYENKYYNIDGNVIDCLGNKIKKCHYWIPTYEIYTNTKQDAENIKEYIESGNDYTAYFFDAMIESTGKYKADADSAIFKVPFTSDMVKYARPNKETNIKLEQDDDGVQLIDGYGMSIKVGKDISAVCIVLNKSINEVLSEKIMNYDLGHRDIGVNIIDNYGHRILKFYDSSFGRYTIYAENYQEAEEIASELNNNDCDYTLYFYDNVKESTGKHKVDESKALFKAPLTADMIKNAAYTKTKDVKAVLDENGIPIIEGVNVSFDVGENIYEIRINLAKSYNAALSEKIMNYDLGHQYIGTNIIDNYGHKILKFYDSSFGTYAIHAETEEEAKEITSVLNSSNCNYVLYFFDNEIESTGKNKVDTGSAKFNVKFTKDMVKYATAKQNIEKTLVKDSEGLELMDGLSVSFKDGNDLFEVRIQMNKDLSESNKNKVARYDAAHYEGYGKNEIKTKIYDNYGHRINRFYDSSFGTFMINAEDLDQAKEIASVLNSSTCDYTLYFFD